MKNIFKLDYERYYNISDITDAILLIDNDNTNTIIENVKRLENLYSDIVNLNLNYNIFKALQGQYSDAFSYIKDELIYTQCMDDSDEFYDYYDLDEDMVDKDKLYELIITGLLDDELLYDVIDTFDILDTILTAAGVRFGTVGYSPWSYYVALTNCEYSFIRDMYEGYDVFNVTQLDEEGKPIDSLGLCYLPTEKDVYECIKLYFNIDESEPIYIVDNEETKYINIPKVKMVPDTTYSFELMEEGERLK